MVPPVRARHPCARGYARWAWSRSWVHCKSSAAAARTISSRSRLTTYGAWGCGSCRCGGFDGRRARASQRRATRTVLVLHLHAPTAPEAQAAQVAAPKRGTGRVPAGVAVVAGVLVERRTAQWVAPHRVSRPWMTMVRKIPTPQHRRRSRPAAGWLALGSQLCPQARQHCLAIRRLTRMTLVARRAFHPRVMYHRA